MYYYLSSTDRCRLSQYWQKVLFGIVVLAILSGCQTTTNVKQVDRLAAVGENPKILIMAPDVKYYLLTAGGVAQPHAEWTKAGRRNFTDSLLNYADARDITTLVLEEDQLSELEIAYQKLYSAIGSSILTHHYGRFKLPTKNGSFDWSLGPGVKEIASRHQADYVLFSFYRDYQASGGRIAFAVLAAIAGVGVSAGQEFGFASLVDLNTGEIVWFNQLSVGAGELREEAGARATIDALFRDLPQS